MMNRSKDVVGGGGDGGGVVVPVETKPLVPRCAPAAAGEGHSSPPPPSVVAADDDGGGVDGRFASGRTNEAPSKRIFRAGYLVLIMLIVGGCLRGFDRPRTFAKGREEDDDEETMTTMIEMHHASTSWSSLSRQEPPTSIAFVGNSMLYFNDFPRFYMALSDVPVRQDSCLHGGAGITDLVRGGNAMDPLFRTPSSILGRFRDESLYDFGACTVKQLLLGTDESLTNDPPEHPGGEEEPNHNPCEMDPKYREFALGYYERRRESPSWDFVVINDNTRNPARGDERDDALRTLEVEYVPWLLETGTIPVFLWTHAYSLGPGGGLDAAGLDDVANFTSLTYAGYAEYVRLLRGHLPERQSPRIAPVGLAFLMVYEENPDLWRRLFHIDRLHASPLGTFLQGCVVHETITGRVPALPREEDPIESLWRDARMMQHYWDPPNPYPTREEAEYLHGIATRIANGEIPGSFILYENGETATPGGG